MLAVGSSTGLFYLSPQGGTHAVGLVAEHLPPRGAFHPGSPRVERYEDADVAKARLFAVELELSGDLEHGVVLLYGDTEESLRLTHGSFFLYLDELLETAQS